ncbi:MAG: bifunctional 4-hydroxy-2-oxoglutarate aldolase/2-dehydro-3-deoxy-phosphogluconate aldolase [Fibrobacteria bacterium]|nr:bifunctional 4-hydroxy-2-oxoglutarate aldolase/2-dehydro-3-deoxy-phosphogluconate aldolase [Fibrobacteria bacterium]
MDIEQFKTLPLLCILRGITKDQTGPVTRGAIHSGLKAIEVTMNTEGATSLISEMKQNSGDAIAIGAGTVLNKDDTKKALDAGASFIVSPITSHEVIDYCLSKKVPVFPGAMTPQEVYRAWDAGATMVKVFPAKNLGPSYCKELKGPFSQISLLACGGITVDNINDWFQNGTDAIAFGGITHLKGDTLTEQMSTFETYLTKLITTYLKAKKD